MKTYAILVNNKTQYTHDLIWAFIVAKRKSLTGCKVSVLNEERVKIATYQNGIKIATYTQSNLVYMEY